MIRTCLLTALAVSLVACSKPSEVDCTRAVENIIRLTAGGEDAVTDKPKVIRSCRGSSTKKSVECAIKAENVEQLNACGGDFADKYVKEAEEADRKNKEKGAQDANKAAEPADPPPGQ